MHIQKVSRQFLTVFLLLPFLACLAGTAAADVIDEVAASPAEVDFINRVVEQVKVSMPAIDGWERNISVYTSQRSVRDGMQLMIYEGARDYPMNVSIELNFKTITEADRKQAAEEKSIEALQQEMMTAAQSGDIDKMAELQLQLGTILQSQMEAGAIGQAASLSPITRAEEPTKFYVRVIVNGDGEHISNEYDIAEPGVTKAFRIDKDNDDLLSYKYYMGAWGVSELDAKNWRIVSPVADQTPANHLRAVVLFAIVHGDRESVERYVRNSMDLEGLNGVLD